MGNQAAPDNGALLTTNAELQAKLNKLNELAKADKIDEFVEIFVPLDLTADDLDHYKYVRHSQWLPLVSKLLADYTL
jgi:hypothetical protein